MSSSRAVRLGRSSSLAVSRHAGQSPAAASSASSARAVQHATRTVHARSLIQQQGAAAVGHWSARQQQNVNTISARGITHTTRGQAGLTGLLFDAVLISAAAAGVRRTTGFSVQRFAEGYVTNPGGRAALNGYFKVGEYVVDGVAKLAASERFQEATKNARDDKDRRDDDRLDDGRRR